MRFQAKQLSCIRGHKTLFKNLSFELDSGQLLLVEGNNGVGKTSLLKILTGLRKADKGQVFWHNRDIQKNGETYRQALSWLGHQNPLKEELSALENLQILGAIRCRNNQCAIQALHTVGLSSYKNKMVKTFSAGMKRRLSLASLLIAETPVWILDEPQTSLDRSGMQMFEKIAVQHLKNNGMIIMTSHLEFSLNGVQVKTISLGV